MKVRVRYLFAAIFAIPLLVAGTVAYRDFDEQKMIREEEMLNALNVGPFAVEGEAFETVLQRIEKRMHEKGHPEVRLRMYSDARQVSYFHRELNPLSVNEQPSPALSFTLGQNEPLSAGELLKYVSVLHHSTCGFRGRNLVVVPAVGTIERFRYLSAHVAFLAKYDDEGFRRWFEGIQSFRKYEGMTLEVDRQKSVFVYIGPESIVDDFEMGVPWNTRLRQRVPYWRYRLFGR